MTSRHTLGDVFAETLRRNGVPYVFGIPGGGSAIDLIEACRKVGIPFVLVQHETTAAMSAIVAGELSDSCGVCMSIMGPGAANLAGGASFGLWERHAVLSLTEAHPLAQAPQMSLQQMDHAQMFTSFSKVSEVLGVDGPAGQIDRLIELARAERPGPVHLDVPNDLLAQPSSPEASGRQVDFEYESGLTGDLDAIVDAIDGADKPVLLVGPAVVRADACGELVTLAERLGAAVVVTSKARGVISEVHPLFAGIFTGVYGLNTFEGRIICQSDLVITIGLDRMELLSPWNFPQKLVSIDAIDAADERVGSPAHTVYGPLKLVVSELADSVHPAKAWSTTEIRDFWDLVRSSLSAESSQLNSTTLLERARRLAPDDTILVSETGIYNAVNLFTWKVPTPTRYFGSSGANTMGFSIPAALASSLVRPNQKTVALVGDGGFLMKVSELETLARERLAPIVVVFNDRSLGLIRVKQAAKGYHRDAVDLAPVDFVRLAQSFGGRGDQVNTLDAFEESFKAALDADRFTLIDARLDPDVYASHMRPIRG